MAFKVIIAGGRNFQDHKFLFAKMDHLLSGVKDQIEIVSGGANGADALGEGYAIARGLDYKVFPANWKEYGKTAGPMRNKAMAEYADALVAFWDRESKGTANMINVAYCHNLKVKIVYY